MDQIKKPRRFSRLWRWGIAVLAMVFVVREVASDPETLRRLLGTPLDVCLLQGLLFVVSQVLMAFRLSLTVAHAGGTGVPARVWFRLISVGQLLNTFVPQLGSVYRAVALKREYGVSYMSYASGLLAFVWLDLVMGVLLASVTIAALDPGLTFQSISALLLLAIVLGALLVLPFAALGLVSVLPVKPGFVAKTQARVSALLTTVGSALRKPAFLLRYFLLSVLVTLVQVAALGQLFRAVGADLDVSTLLLFQVVFKLSTQIVITPGNLGVTEILFGLLSYGAQSTLEQGLAVSLLFRAVSTVMSIALGVLFGGTRLLFAGRREVEAESAREQS